jgi:diguanylate cyclase (GGDEF)-like protein
MVDSALRDPLTRLYNQRYFAERLDAELRFARRHGSALAVLMIDIDHFKRVNDQRGHLVGDSVLGAVALTLARAVRNEDVVARYGGEEFVVLLRATALDAAVLLAERLRRKVEDLSVPCDGGAPVAVTVSAGAAAFPADGIETAHDLIGAADRALYVAKGAGRNRVDS